MKIVLVRHGQSEWNLENKFTGWVDVNLSEKGNNEAISAGKALKDAGYEFDVAYTSGLTRAQKTLAHILSQINEQDLPTHKDDRLNERHYGGLQGLNKEDTAKKYGADQVKIWRRSYDIAPPMSDNPVKGQPNGESLKMTYERVIPYYHQTIEQDLKANKKVLVVAHGNSLRALAKYLLDINDEDIIGFEIPTGKPLVLELDPKTIKATKYYYLEY